MTSIILENQAELFRDAESLARFAALLQVSESGPESKALVWKDQPVAELHRPGALRAVLEERFVQRIATDATFLDELRDRIENDPIVD